MSRYSCNKAGACLGDNPACQLCAIERETQRQTQERERDVWDSIAHWLVVSAVAAASVAVICGLAGFAFQRLTQ